MDNIADIFVLIIGGRYGYQDDNGKSVTNLEYLRARAKHIPIYIFVDKKILSTLPIWRDNRSGNFQAMVDTPKLFEFVDNVMTSDNAWVFPFEHAQEITEALRKQFAHLLLEGLSLRQRLIEKDDFLQQLNGNELRLILEKPIAWEYRLFSQTVANGIRNANYLRRDVKYGITLAKGDKITNINDISDFINSQIQVLLRLASNLMTLVNIVFQEAVGAPGEPGNPEYIVYVAEKFVENYKSTLEWTIHIRSTDVPEECQKLVLHLADFCKNIINEIEDFSRHMATELDNAVRQVQLGNTSIAVELNLNLCLTAPDMTEFSNELALLVAKYNLSKT